MMPREIRKHELDVVKVLPYFLDHINCGKILSKRIIEKIDFTKGSFFTILPSDAKLDKLFDFSHGGIIPPIPCEGESYHIKGSFEEFHPNKIITMDYECSEFMASFLKKNNENWAVIENYMLNPDSAYVNFQNVKMIPFNCDVYYFLNRSNSIKEIHETIRKSNQVWHFLAVLTRLKNDLFSCLTDTIIHQICENLEFVIVGSYDGEGYIFWEKSRN